MSRIVEPDSKPVTVKSTAASSHPGFRPLPLPSPVASKAGGSLRSLPKGFQDSLECGCLDLSFSFLKTTDAKLIAPSVHVNLSLLIGE